MRAMRVLIVLAVLSCGASYSVNAQSTEGLIGRDVRVWTHVAPKPVSGLVTHSTPTFIRMTTGTMVCSESGCARSFSSPWSDIARMQVNSQSRGERILRAVLIGGGAGAILIGGMSVCKGGGRTNDEISTCFDRIVGTTAAAGLVGLAVSRPRWRDVPVPDGSR